MNEDARALPGFKKQSFAMPFGGGEIWIEHLDGLYGHAALVMEKLTKDSKIFLRPNMPAYMCINIQETAVTDELLEHISYHLLNASKAYRKVCFVGAHFLLRRKIERALGRAPFMLACINDFEKAKEWLIH